MCTHLHVIVGWNAARERSLGADLPERNIRLLHADRDG